MTQYENILGELRSLSNRIQSLEQWREIDSSDITEIKEKVCQMTKTLYGNGKSEDVGLVGVTSEVKKKVDDIFTGVKWVVGIIVASFITQLIYLISTHAGGQ